MESGEHNSEAAATDDGQFVAVVEERTEQLEQEVERLRAGLEAERERGLRTLAEFDNYRRRARLERARAEQDGKRDMLLALLDVMDDFERAMGHAGEAPDAVAEGLRLVHQRLGRMLESNGVTPIRSVGEHFDPEIHEATGVVDGGEYESGAVSEEERRGYLLNGELLRPARVIVVR